MKFSPAYPFKKILIPTDFSAVSLTAVNYAIGLAKVLDARLILFHAIHLPLEYTKSLIEIASPEELKKQANQKLQQLRDERVKETGFREIEIKCSFGLAVDAICDEVEESYVDLVIMATQGASGLDELIIGSNAAEVTERCSCPVMAIPAGSDFTIPKRIFYATDYADNDFQSIFMLTQFFRIFRPEIIVAHVEDKHNHRIELDRMLLFQDQVRRNIPYDRISFLLIKGDTLNGALMDHFEANSYDLLSTSMRHRNIFDRFTSRSLTKKIINHSNLPLIAFHTIKKPATPLF